MPQVIILLASFETFIIRHTETEGVINAVASLIGMQDTTDPNSDDVNRLQYLETDVRKLCALETEWKKCAHISLLSLKSFN